jgi:hypothetical protein
MDILISCKRHPEELKKAPCVLVVPGRRDNGQLKAAGLVYFIVFNLREGRLLGKSQGIVPRTVKGIARHPLEFPDAG